ncbi:winged helix-turn-helix transcriptional regulator [Brevundimonas staleyi]|uniref:Winged helix-turn-helix transcriptional regulator n=1 Tax=Brevundimonas staleyi TaxID=74326 RepID=A0ABW0FM52_9CAUL
MARSATRSSAPAPRDAAPPVHKDLKLTRTCSIARALEVVGDAPTLLILHAAWIGARRFGDFRSRTQLLQAQLSDRLKRLVAHGVFRLEPYGDSESRMAYRLTPKGLDLYWMALTGVTWERRWLTQEHLGNIRLRHRGCGHAFVPLTVCTTCDHQIRFEDVTPSAGPGAGWMSATYSRRRQQRNVIDLEGAGPSFLTESILINGDRWATLILRAIFSGYHRFEDIRLDAGMATNILSERLNWLQSIGMVRAQTYDVAYNRVEYHLTEKGAEFYPILVMLMVWGDAHYPSPEGPPEVLLHAPDGHPLTPAVVCSHCREPVGPRDVEFERTPAD